MESGGLQPKGMSDSGGVSLDPNEPNRLPGMVRLAQINNDTLHGVSPPVTPTSATKGTAFAGQCRKPEALAGEYFARSASCP